MKKLSMFLIRMKLIINKEISKLVVLTVIKETHRQENQIVSPIFLRKKKNGEYRMAINLEKLNKHIAYNHFKMENFEQAVRLINKGDHMASIDLKHAYYTVKLQTNNKNIYVLNGLVKCISSHVWQMVFQKGHAFSLN